MHRFAALRPAWVLERYSQRLLHRSVELSKRLRFYKGTIMAKKAKGKMKGKGKC
jgi:hypothetical protein